MEDEDWKTILFYIWPKREKKSFLKYGQTSILNKSCTLLSALRFVCDFSNFHLIIFRSQTMWGVVRVQDKSLQYVWGQNHGRKYEVVPTELWNNQLFKLSVETENLILF